NEFRRRLGRRPASHRGPTWSCVADKTPGIRFAASGRPCRLLRLDPVKLPLRPRLYFDGITGGGGNRRGTDRAAAAGAEQGAGIGAERLVPVQSPPDYDGVPPLRGGQQAAAA